MGVILFILASATVGIRLLLVYKRLRQPPELFLGLGYLWAGTIGWGGLLVGLLNTPKGEQVKEIYSACSVVAGDIGSFCFYLFVWYVFRRESRVAKLSLVVIAVVMVTSLVRDTWLIGVTFGPPPGTATTLAAAIIRGLVFAWMAFEAFRGYFAFRKRARIGLGNPLVQNRLLLWGLSALPSQGVSVLAVSLYVISTDQADAAARQNAVGEVYGALALLAAMALTLAFFPPKAYQAWLDRSAARGAGDG